MAKIGPLVGKEVTLKPTQGAYQKVAKGEIVEETPTRITVRLVGRLDRITFIKSTGSPYSERDKKFPCYVLDPAQLGIESTDAPPPNKKQK
jgi:hypothetical protein